MCSMCMLKKPPCLIHTSKHYCLLLLLTARWNILQQTKRPQSPIKLKQSKCYTSRDLCCGIISSIINLHLKQKQGFEKYVTVPTENKGCINETWIWQESTEFETGRKGCWWFAEWLSGQFMTFPPCIISNGTSCVTS